MGQSTDPTWRHIESPRRRRRAYVEVKDLVLYGEYDGGYYHTESREETDVINTRSNTDSFRSCQDGKVGENEVLR